MTMFTDTRVRAFSTIVRDLPEYRAFEQAKREWLDAHIVYFAQFGGPGGLIKIGYTGDLDKRILALGKSAPLPVEAMGWMEGGHGREQRLHRKFHTSRFNGEWFQATPQLVDFIAEHARTDTPPEKPSRAELVRLEREKFAAIRRVRREYDAYKTS